MGDLGPRPDFFAAAMRFVGLGRENLGIFVSSDVHPPDPSFPNAKATGHWWQGFLFRLSGIMPGQPSIKLARPHRRGRSPPAPLTSPPVPNCDPLLFSKAVAAAI